MNRVQYSARQDGAVEQYIFCPSPASRTFLPLGLFYAEEDSQDTTRYSKRQPTLQRYSYSYSQPAFGRLVG
jgi:hypothetical protein